MVGGAAQTFEKDHLPLLSLENSGGLLCGGRYVAVRVCGRGGRASPEQSSFLFLSKNIIDSPFTTNIQYRMDS